MSDTSFTDEELRDAFASLAADRGDGPSDEDVDHIWRAVSGDLPAAERQALVARLATEPVTAEAWRLARELHDSAGLTRERPLAEVVPMPTRTSAPAAASSPSRSIVPWWLPIAATVLLVLGGGYLYQVNQRGGDEFRQPAGAEIRSRLSADAPLARSAARLQWTPGPDGSRYTVRITTDDLRPVATLADLAVPEVTIEPAALAAVPAGGRILWQVEMSVPGGEIVTSPTFVAQVP